MVELLKRVLDELMYTLERAHARDREMYISRSMNAREVTQRIRFLEHEKVRL